MTLTNTVTEAASKSFRDDRILAWLYPDDYPQASMQSRYSMYAIGFGGILGRGLGRGTMKYYLPFSTNDFIFGVIGEELGLVGCGLVVFLFVYQVWRIFTVAQHAKDKLGSYMAFGVGIHVALQVILNVALPQACCRIQVSVCLISVTVVQPFFCSCVRWELYSISAVRFRADGFESVIHRRNQSTQSTVRYMRLKITSVFRCLSKENEFC